VALRLHPLLSNAKKIKKNMFVILSEAKNLLSLGTGSKQVLASLRMTSSFGGKTTPWQNKQQRD
jgi:hypothetical protein